MGIRRRVLLVEDDPSVLKMTRLRLEHEGFDVVTAMDGEQALEEADAQLPIHLVLLDVKLPKLNGYEVCRTLKHRTKTAHIPVIVFSASESQMQKMADRCIEVGATDWIKKPFRTIDLMSKIRHALEPQEESHG